MSTVHKPTANDAVARKGLLALAAAIADATTAEFATRITDYLADIASSDGCDAETADLLSNVIIVMRPPAVPPRHKFTVIQGGAA